MAIRHFLDIWQMEAGELRAMLDEAHAMKAARRGWPKGRVDEGALWTGLPGAGQGGQCQQRSDCLAVLPGGRVPGC